MRGERKVRKTEIVLLLLAALFALGMTVTYRHTHREPQSSYEVTTVTRRAVQETAVEKVNINTASQEELENLPGIGEALAGRIVEYRRENGAFAAPEDLLGVKGIGEKTLEEMREYMILEVAE